MYPQICAIGPVKIYSYGVMLAVAVVVCAFLAARDARRYHIASQEVFDLVFWSVLFGLIGARLFFVLLNLPFFLERPWEILFIHHGGLAWQGGFLGGTVAGIVFVRKRRLPFTTMLDLSAPYIALGQAIGRLGCFLNGCCYGRPVSWGLHFPGHGAHLHPTQLYAAGALLVIFMVLKFAQRRSVVPGAVFALYMVLAATQRFLIEFFRADHVPLAGGLSVFQYVTFVIFIAGAGFYMFLRRCTVR